MVLNLQPQQKLKKKSQFLFSSSSSFSSLQAALMCGNSRSNSHQRNGSWLAHNSVQECRHFAEKGNVFSHKNPTQCHDFRFENSQIKMTLNYSNKYPFKSTSYCKSKRQQLVLSITISFQRDIDKFFVFINIFHPLPEDKKTRNLSMFTINLCSSTVLLHGLKQNP